MEWYNSYCILMREFFLIFSIFFKSKKNYTSFSNSSWGIVDYSIGKNLSFRLWKSLTICRSAKVASLHSWNLISMIVEKILRYLRKNLWAISFVLKYLLPLWGGGKGLSIPVGDGRYPWVLLDGRLPTIP